ncbi:endolytic transglycosylase MltG [Paenibacillus sp. NEAU-GSW1]|uniref:endolytic transglycosylase MltG n=1 Tax=Paenibacillus sp. NEAU-GSW1 TaxID=2682486 RepID=UPI0012E27A04|nr:endolytic transglycosylase MltG [Paenibacillus sp. NEAU-GSW1]MUT67249.1 endolytic transglycosylase MltG [Paenibacillus sp. NEAU-GSW1]
MWVVISLFSIFIIGAGSVFLYLWIGLQPTKAGEVKQVEIKKGSSAFAVSDVLEEQGIIKNSFLFKYYLKLKDEGDRFQAGVYELKPGMTNAEIIAKLNSGETVAEETIKFTIPEGFTLLQIADKLAEEKLIDKAAFLEAADKQSDWGDAEAIRSIPTDAKLHHRLEGYLFPETYEMKVDSTEADILQRMMEELDKKLADLPEGWEDVLAERKLSLHQLLTIASLVEREVVVDEERAVVAGVISNRLKKGMPLQIDATVQYLLDKPKERLMEKDLQVDSPYNTYKINGLPPGPIASPSFASIQAALYPEDTDFFYYVTKKDGSQTHLFAATYKEHLRNIEKSNQTAKQGE